MTEVNMLKVHAHEFFENSGGCIVAQVPVTAEDSLLHAPGPAGIVLQHFHVVVGFKHEDV
jgi:hypothetical protein